MMDEISAFAVDWDETVTSADTMALVSQAAYEQKPNFEPKWQHFVDQYLKDYKAYADTKTRDSLEAETQFLTGLKEVEMASIQRVENSGLFKGLNEADIAAKASKVQYRQGWWELVARLSARKIPIVVISVNWSAALIKQAFESHGHSQVVVHANVMPKHGWDNLTTGKLRHNHCWGIRTASDKLRILEQVKTQYGPKVCYCGDSSTDLMALRAADVAFVVSNRNSFEKFRDLGLDNLGYITDWTTILP